jgi:signal transduction histidine kinase
LEIDQLRLADFHSYFRNIMLSAFKDDFALLSSRLPREFMITAAIVIVGSMSLLAFAVSHVVRSSSISTAADEGALVVDVFLGPLVQDLASSDKLSAHNTQRLDRLLDTKLGHRARSLKIWLRDGTLTYSTNKQQIGEKFPSPLIAAAFGGKPSGTFDELDSDHEQLERQMKRHLIEVYAPLYRLGTDEIIAVAQIYNDGERLAADLSAIQISSIAVIAAVTVPMMIILFLVVRRTGAAVDLHRRRLKRSVLAARGLAARNNKLRQEADAARLETVRSNEELLQNIGQDLHDGPIQSLSVLALKLGDPVTPPTQSASTSSTPTAQDILTSTVTDLRHIAQGLVLPQIDHLSTEETLRLAVEEHQNVTGTTVTSEIRQLPVCSKSLRICLFRVVQEALNNAFNYSDGRGQHVAASLDGQAIQVAISDSGPAAFPAKRTHRCQIGLGLRGLRRRIELLHGTFDVTSREDGTYVTARIPIGA